MTVFYMSFVHPDAPKGQRFAGACLVRGDDLEDAIGNAWRLGCNPGGEIQSLVPEFIPDDKWFNRLLSRADLAEMEVELNEKYHKNEPRKTPAVYQ